MVTISQSYADLAQIAPLHRFSTADYLEMIDKSVLGPEDHVELLGGIIANMSPQGSRHAYFLMRLNRLFAPLMGQHQIMIQSTLVVAEGQVFDPDFLLLRQKEGYKKQLPRADDVLLVVEAEESSLQRDQKIKLPVYAAAGISEYWIADLDREELIIHREPEDTAYRVIENRRGDELISPCARRAVVRCATSF